MLRFNPAWQAAGYARDIPADPDWERHGFRLRTFHSMDVALPLTRESWRGRIRACRGVGAALDAATIDAFDRAHAALLEELVGDAFEVPHQATLHVFERIADRRAPTGKRWF